MTGFTTTGSTSHSTLVSGLNNGNSYAYYIKCQDSAGNITSSDYTISFSVASAGGGISLNLLQQMNKGNTDSHKSEDTNANAQLIENETSKDDQPSSLRQPADTAGNAGETGKAEDLIAKIIREAGELMKRSGNRLNRFITQGTESTKILGVGERAGVVTSFKAVFKREPQSQKDWEDVLKIANGRWPSQRDEKTEKNAEAAFRKIYLRNPNKNNAQDNNAIAIISYGLRPTQRNMNSEKQAINSFKAIYGYAPKSTSAWDIVRAIAYSGAKR